MGGMLFDGNVETAESDIEYPIQYSFDFADSSVNALKVELGRFYEILSRGIFGGVWHDRRKINGDDLTSEECEPDLIHDEHSCYRETKGVALSQALKLFDKQIRKYARLQFDDVPYNNPIIIFDIFRHGIKELQREYCEKKLDNLIERLCDDTRYLVSMPFSIIHKIHESGVNGYCKFTSRYDGVRYPTLTRISSRGLDFLMNNPMEIIKEIGLEPNDYRISYKIVNGLRMNKKRVKSFPTLIINENDHKGWVKGFRDKNKENMGA